MHKKINFYAASSLAALALLPAAPAYAQDGEATSTDGAIEEIIVTAQKREEKAQDVPIACRCSAQKPWKFAAFPIRRIFRMWFPA